MVLRANKTQPRRPAGAVHLRMLDLYEYLLSTNTDYALLRQTFGGTPVLDGCAGWCWACKDLRKSPTT
jgi:hypothetical protein